MPRFAAFLLIVLGIAGCAASSGPDNLTLAAAQPAPLDPTRSISVRDCSRPIEAAGGNLSCR